MWGKNRKTPKIMDNFSDVLTLEGAGCRPGQLLGYPWKLWVVTVQTSYVEGRWHQNWAYTSQTLFFADGQGNQWKKPEFFYSSARYSETKRDIGMGHKRWKGRYTYRGTNAFWAKSGCGPFFAVFCLLKAGRLWWNASCQKNKGGVAFNLSATIFRIQASHWISVISNISK